MEVLPKISIVTPSYNQGRFIEETIQSVLNQSYPNFEHIITDGGSTDNTVEILKKYPHLIWISEPDEGQSDAINKGFKMATGEIIGWINSDDYYLQNAFSVVVNELSNAKVDAIYSNTRFIDANGKVTREVVTQNSVKWMSLFYCFIRSETFFFKRKILDDGVFVDKHYDITMDMEFFAHIYYAGYKIKKVNAFLAHFRWHDSNKSLDTKPVNRARHKEALETFNRYSGFAVPSNKITIALHTAGIYVCKVIRTTCRTFNIGIYRRSKLLAEI